MRGRLRRRDDADDGATVGDNSIVGHDLVVDHRTDNGSIRALQCDHVSIGGGRSLAVMGPSGCGKSTLLGLLAGLAVPTKGSVTVGGVEISGMRERDRVRFRRRMLGMVYQADNLLPHLTVEENLRLQLAICRRGGAGADGANVEHVLDRLGIGSLAHRLPDQLSGGQRQRVAVGRAIIHRPAVLLADEPTGALDDQTASAVIELLVELHREIGATLVLVTHDPKIATHLEETFQLRRPSPTAPSPALDLQRAVSNEKKGVGADAERRGAPMMGDSDAR